MAIGPGESLAWERLADALIQRRIDLRYRSRRAFSDAREIGYRLAYDVEEHRRTNFAKATMLDIARAYAVTPESIDQLLHGQGELEPVPQPAAAASPSPAAVTETPEPVDDEVRLPADVAAQMADAALRSIAPEIRIRAESVLSRNPSATGRDIFPQWPRVAEVWDAVEALTFAERVVYAATARLQDLREEWRNRRSG